MKKKKRKRKKRERKRAKKEKKELKVIIDELFTYCSSLIDLKIMSISPYRFCMSQ